MRPRSARRLPAGLARGLLGVAAAAGVLAAQGANPTARAGADPAGAAVPVIAPLPVLPSATIANLTPHPGYFNEPAIAINPLNPKQAVTAFQVRASVGYTDDGGDHWLLANGTAPLDYRVSGDVSVAYDNAGHALLCYIAFDKLGTENYWANKATRNGIFVRRSPDGGKTWEAQAIPVVRQPTQPGIPFEDKPWIVADSGHGPNRGDVYVGWTEFRLSESVIDFSRSQDDGRTWSAPRIVSEHQGLPRDDNGAVEGFSGAVAADGTLSIVWTDGNRILFRQSHDRGRSFTPERAIVITAPSYFDVVGTSRSNGFPQIAWAPDVNHRRAEGILYVGWSDYRNGDVDVFCIHSTDGGRTWSAPVRVNSDSLHDGADQFFERLATDPITGACDMIFYDRRGDPRNRNARITLATSSDGGRTFVNADWGAAPFNPSGAFIGDYIGVAAWNNVVFGVWTEQRPAQAGETSLQRHTTVVRVGRAILAGAGIEKRGGAPTGASNAR